MKRKEKVKLDPEAMYVSWQGFSCELPGGLPFTCQKGTRLRGDHPAVKSQPSYFRPDGTPDSEIPDPTVPELIDEYADTSGVTLPGDLKPEDTLVCVKRCGVEFPDGSLMLVNVGDKVDRRSAIAQRAPKGSFRPLTDAEK